MPMFMYLFTSNLSSLLHECNIVKDHLIENVNNTFDKATLNKYILFNRFTHFYGTKISAKHMR